MSKLPGLGRWEKLEQRNTRYKARSLKNALLSCFPAANQPIFGGRHSLSSVKVAVTSTLSTAKKPALLFTNYNRPSHETLQRKFMLTMALSHTETPFQLCIFLSGPITLKLNSKCGRRECVVGIANKALWLTTYLGHELHLRRLDILSHSRTSIPNVNILMVGSSSITPLKWQI